MGTANDARGARKAAAGAVIATVASVSPVFLVGGFSVLMERDLRFTEAGLGIAVAIYFTVCAFASVPAGRLANRFGPTTVTRAGIVIAATALLAIGTLAHSYALFVVILALAGFGNACGQLGSNLSLAEWIPVHRQGLSYGVKQAAIPVSTLLAGLAVPAIGLTLGWRWAFVFAGAIALVALAAVPRSGTSGRRAAGDRDAKTAALVVIAIGAALGASAANALGTFLVSSSVEHGIDAGTAGLVLALGSVFGVASRVTAGWIADQRPSGHLVIVVVMLSLGSLGLALLSLNGLPALIIGTIAGFGLGWSWPGVMNFAVVRLNPSAPAAATSITQTGVFAGGVIGPVGFGTVAGATSFSTAWLTAAIVMLAAAILIYAGTRMLATGVPVRSLSPGVVDATS